MMPGILYDTTVEIVSLCPGKEISFAHPFKCPNEPHTFEEWYVEWVARQEVTVTQKSRNVTTSFLVAFRLPTLRYATPHLFSWP